MLSVCVATSFHDIVYSNLLLAQRKVCYVFKEKMHPGGKTYRCVIQSHCLNILELEVIFFCSPASDFYLKT